MNQENQHCKVGKSYPKQTETRNCEPGKLCNLVDEFDMIEKCLDCQKLM